ncbi:hypothetical protein D1007_37128 [Hordeum vulgare]|nr:hypothetical protein D1007_37128 [Hordeum vulgare]
MLLLLLESENLRIALEHGLVAHLLLAVGLLLAEPVRLPTLAIDTRVALLLVFEGEPSLLVGRVGAVLKQSTLLRRELRATPAHLVVVHSLAPQNRRDRYPLRIQVPKVRQHDVRVGEGLPVLPVPPRLVHQDV